MRAARVTFGVACLSVISTACSSPSPIRFEESLPPSVFGERSIDEPVPGPTGIRPGECPAQIAEYPIPYLDNRVLIRLPVGVEVSNFVEVSPYLARTTGSIESGNCQPGMSGALIYFMALTMYTERPQSDRPLEDIRDDMLVEFAYPEKTAVLVEQDYDAGDEAGMWVYEIPADKSKGMPEPVKILVAMWVVHDDTFGLVFEVHPNAWSVIVDTLVASAQHIRMLSP